MNYSLKCVELNLMLFQTSCTFWWKMFVFLVMKYYLTSTFTVYYKCRDRMAFQSTALLNDNGSQLSKGILLKAYRWDVVAIMNYIWLVLF